MACSLQALSVQQGALQAACCCSALYLTQCLCWWVQTLKRLRTFSFKVRGSARYDAPAAAAAEVLLEGREPSDAAATAAAAAPLPPPHQPLAILEDDGDGDLEAAQASPPWVPCSIALLTALTGAQGMRTCLREK